MAVLSLVYLIITWWIIYSPKICRDLLQIAIHFAYNVPNVDRIVTYKYWMALTQK